MAETMVQFVLVFRIWNGHGRDFDLPYLFWGRTTKQSYIIRDQGLVKKCRRMALKALSEKFKLNNDPVMTISMKPTKRSFSEFLSHKLLRKGCSARIYCNFPYSSSIYRERKQRQQKELVIQCNLSRLIIHYRSDSNYDNSLLFQVLFCVCACPALLILDIILTRRRCIQNKSRRE